jgi:hypothetical protein
LIAAARDDAADLEARLTQAFPGLAVSAEETGRMTRAFLGESWPAGLGAGAVAVWQGTALFAVSSARPPMLSLDGGDALEMSSLRGTSYWTRLETIASGRLHIFRYGVDGEWAPGGDFAGYSERSHELPEVRHGTVSERRTVSSKIYPGALTEYWVYVNHGIDEARGAPVMVWHDGSGCLEPGDLFGYRMQIVTDNLAHLRLIPTMVRVLV